MSYKSEFNLIYKFDPVAIPNWQERLASAYKMLFKKIDELETKRLIGSKGKGEDYEGYTTH